VQPRLVERDHLHHRVDGGLLADDALAEPVADVGAGFVLSLGDHKNRQAAVDGKNLLDEMRRQLAVLAHR